MVSPYDKVLQLLDLPCVDDHERNRNTCEEYGDEEQELSPPQVGQRADQRSTQE